MENNLPEQLWKSKIDLTNGELIVYTTDHFCPVTHTPVNYVSGESLAEWLGEPDHATMFKKLSPDFNEFIIKVDRRFGNGSPPSNKPLCHVWDTMNSSRLLISFLNPDIPVRNLSLNDIIGNSVWLDLCIDYAFGRGEDAPIYMQTRTAARKFFL